MVKKKDRTAKDESFVFGEKEDDVEEVDYLVLAQDQENERRLERSKQADSGTIPDPRVFHLMYLEKCAVEASLQIQVRKNAYTSRIEVLKQELINIVRQWEDTQKKSIRKISDIRREFENDYGIYFNQWGYDEETGSLTKLPQDVLNSIDEQRDRGKLKEDSTKDAPVEPGAS